MNLFLFALAMCANVPTFPTEKLMAVRCAWCGRDMGEKLGPAGLVSHGICAACADRVLAERGRA